METAQLAQLWNKVINASLRVASSTVRHTKQSADIAGSNWEDTVVNRFRLSHVGVGTYIYHVASKYPDLPNLVCNFLHSRRFPVPSNYRYRVHTARLTA
jgi:hypothetical protein